MTRQLAVILAFVVLLNAAIAFGFAEWRASAGPAGPPGPSGAPGAIATPDQCAELRHDMALADPDTAYGYFYQRLLDLGCEN